MNARRTSHDRYSELAVGHALAALEPAEQDEFSQHLLACEPCSAAVAEHQETLAELAYDAPAVDLPASLLAGIRAEVAASGRVSADTAAPIVTSLDQARDRRRARSMSWSSALVGAAASVVLLMALVLVNSGTSSNTDTTNAANERLSAAVSQLLVSGAKTIDLTGGDERRAVAVVNGNKLSLVLSGFPVNDRKSSIYVLWEQSRFGDVRAVGTFDVDNGDLVVVNGLTLASNATFKALMVTHEQGRKAPPLSTQQPLLVGTTT